MKRVWWLTIILAGAGIAQWRHFGESAPEAPPVMPKEMVAAHNRVRARVGTAALIWSDALAAAAQQWANSLIESGQFVHSQPSKFGENLYEIRGAAATPAMVVDTWASEAKDYDYATNGCRGMCGHYTQVVWGDTKAVGCAVARAGKREVWVCEYDPPGNWVGRKPY